MMRDATDSLNSPLYETILSFWAWGNTLLQQHVWQTPMIEGGENKGKYTIFFFPSFGYVIKPHLVFIKFYIKSN